jgi:hypothetical protein
VTANASTGTVSITAHSPLTIGGAITAGGNITLTAGSPPWGINDVLTIDGNGSVLSSVGNVNLSAGNGINAATGSVSAPKGIVNLQANLNTPPSEVLKAVDTNQPPLPTNPTTPADGETLQDILKSNLQATVAPNAAITAVGSTSLGGTIGGTADSFAETESNTASTVSDKSKDDGKKSDESDKSNDSGKDKNKDLKEKANGKPTKC